MLGPPGSGKGTQADLICREFAIGHISTGEILRQAIYDNTSLGRKSKALIEAGHLVPDEIITELLQETIAEPKYSRGFILDGFPRTMNQNKALLDAQIAIDAVVYLRVSDQAIVERLTGRRYHPGSGRVYHVQHNRPKQPGLDDLTGEPLITRPDDTKEVIEKRLHVYHKNTEEIIQWYQLHANHKFIEIDGSLPKQDIFSKIVEFIGVNSNISL